ncbi:MAG: BACON domain-containing protein, partial [Bacteroidales bacterium]|nr:BACON domain-containing protein [Bacteroidales bacterium]
MKNRFLSFFALLLTVVFLSGASCTKNPPVNPGGGGGGGGAAAATLNVTYNDGDVMGAGATVNVTVSSNTSWRVTTNVTYLTITPPSGSGDATLKIIFPKNSTENERTAEITVTAGDLKKTVTIKQLGFSEFTPISAVRALYQGADTKVTGSVKIKASVIS